MQIDLSSSVWLKGYCWTMAVQGSIWSLFLVLMSLSACRVSCVDYPSVLRNFNRAASAEWLSETKSQGTTFGNSIIGEFFQLHNFALNCFASNMSYKATHLVNHSVREAGMVQQNCFPIQIQNLYWIQPPNSGVLCTNAIKDIRPKRIFKHKYCEISFVYYKRFSCAISKTAVWSNVGELSHMPHCFEGVRIMFMNCPWAIHVLVMNIHNPFMYCEITICIQTEWRHKADELGPSTIGLSIDQVQSIRYVSEYGLIDIRYVSWYMT